MGKNEIYKRDNLMGPFLVLWVPDPLPPSSRLFSYTLGSSHMATAITTSAYGPAPLPSAGTSRALRSDCTTRDCCRAPPFMSAACRRHSAPRAYAPEPIPLAKVRAPHSVRSFRAIVWNSRFLEMLWTGAAFGGQCNVQVSLTLNGAWACTFRVCGRQVEPSDVQGW